MIVDLAGVRATSHYVSLVQTRGARTHNYFTVSGMVHIGLAGVNQVQQLKGAHGHLPPAQRGSPHTRITSESTEDKINLLLSSTERHKLLSEDSSDSGADEEKEDDDLEGPPAKQFSPSKEAFIRLDSTSKQLKNDKRRKVIEKLITPSVDKAQPPKLNDTIASLLAKSAKSFDKYQAAEVYSRCNGPYDLALGQVAKRGGGFCAG